MSRDYETIMLETEDAMEKVLDHLRHELVGITAGKASPAMVENIKFDYYGTQAPLKQAASIATPDAGTLTIKPFDASQVKIIVKAIHEANIGLNPSDDGKMIICRIPPMTQENREKLAKQVKEYAERSKVAVRNARHEAMKHGDASLKEAVLTEDDHTKLKAEIQRFTDKFNKLVDETLEKKTKEIMKV